MQARLVLSALCLAIVALAGCELVADFDRDKIPGGGLPDSGFIPLPPDDAGADAGDADDAGMDDDAGS